jgi:hypoxanthine phosphoribosyltransferase
MDRQFKIVNYSYNEMKADLLSIIQGIESTSWKPDVIVGLTRGGLVPAVMVSHYFEIPLIPF